MNPTIPTSSGPLRAGPDDLDGLLRDFYRAQMPSPWPELKAPVKIAAPDVLPVSRTSRRWNLFRSRMVLAASIVALLIGVWSLSGKFSDYSSPPAAVDGGSENDVAGKNKRPKMIKLEMDGEDGKDKPRVKRTTIEFDNE